jgi:hypothetical protein
MLSFQELWIRQLDKLTTGRHALRAPLDLTRQVTVLREQFSDVSTQFADKDRIREALQKLEAGGVAALKSRDRYVLAYGLTQGSPVLNGRGLIEEKSLFSALLQRWRRDAETGRLGRAVWRGLFRSYLQAAASAEAESLRLLLSESAPRIMAGTKSKPAWLATIERHLGLLTTKPCNTYVAELLAGRREMLDDLLQAIPPPAPSWFWNALVHAIVSHVERLNDAQFKERTEFILRLTELQQLIPRRDEILAMMLERSAKRRDQSRDPVLLAFALEHWKSPQLKSSLRWSQVEPGTKKMVCGWLAVEDLEDFYRLCQDERQVDDRRLKYWLRFKEQIGFSQIVLGSALHRSTDPDIRQFRERKKGRLAYLSDDPSNNAILMQIDEWLFVEFSATGNACYPYKVANVPFEKGSPYYSRVDLKSKQAVTKSKSERLTHILDWEVKFDSALERWGLRPDSAASPRRSASGIRSQGSRERPGDAGGPVHSNTSGWADGLSWELVHLLRMQGAKVEDLRKMGGSLWIYIDSPSGELERQLKGAGFRLRIGRGYHRE